VDWALGRWTESKVGLGLLLGGALLQLAARAVTAAVAGRLPRLRIWWLLPPIGAAIVGGSFAAARARAEVGKYGMLAFELAHDRDRLKTIFDGCDAACQAQVGTAVRWDFLLLASYGIGFFALFLLVRDLLMRAGRRRTATVAGHLAKAAIGAALLDAVENIGLLATLSRRLWEQRPALQGARWADLVPAVTFAASMVKWALLYGAAATVAITAPAGVLVPPIRALIKRVGRRPAKAAAPTTPLSAADAPPAAMPGA
jgi:hypothetical protein